MEKIKIRIKSVEFKTTEDNHTLCKVVYEPNDLLSHNVFHAIAILHKGDTYDKKMGERISFAKAERLAYKHARRNAKIRIEKMENQIKTMRDFYDKADNCFTHNNDYIRQLCGC